MATEGRSAEPARTSALESAGFVRVVARADGDALAASGLLASALAERDTPFQVTVGRTVGDRSERARTTTSDGDATVVIGTADVEDAIRLAASERPATLEAAALARELGATPDPVLALSGVVAAGGEPGAGESEWLLETARDRGLVERRPGVAIPTPDPVDGLAHSTRLRAPWSGDPDATRRALADAYDGDALDADDHRAIGSLVALDIVGADAAADVAAETVGRVLRPYATPDRGVATLGGLADVLEATARTAPGAGAALAMGHDALEPALDAWRDRGRRAHAALDGASTSRYDGLFVVEIADGPVEAVARIAAAYRSPEPTVLVVSEGADDGEAAIVTRSTDPLDAIVEGVARELETAAEAGVAYDVGHRRGYLRFDPGIDESTIVSTTRELL